MKAIVFRRIGSADVLEEGEVEAPQPKPGELRVRVRAAGVNYADVHFRKGEYFIKPTLPDVPGLEASGVVDAIGEGVTLFAPGDRVMLTGLRGYAEMMVAPEHKVYALPSDLSFEDGAALPVQGLTAMHVLGMCARLREGERVLVHAAAGGVGSLAVQIAKRKGAFVIGTTTHRDKLGAIRALGADLVVCTKDEDFTHAARRAGGVDVVLEMIGGAEIYKRDLACLNPFGRMVVYGAASGDLRGAFEPIGLMGKNLAVIGYYLTGVVGRRDLCAPAIEELARMVLRDEVRVVRGPTFPLARASDAHRALESGSTTGKVILTVP